LLNPHDMNQNDSDYLLFSHITAISVVKAEMRRGAATPKIDAVRGAGAISLTRTLIYLILKKILKFLKHYSKFMKYS